MDEGATREWIGREMRSAVSSWTRVASGASRATVIVGLDDGREVVARIDTGDGPMAGTELTLAREGTMYRALAGERVRMPQCHAVSDDGTVLLLERAPGVHDYAEVAQADKHRIYSDYLDALAELHTVNTAQLELPGFARPATATDHAIMELDLWERILDQRTKQPWPLARFAFAVLRRHAPRSVSRTVVCHGDVGPGNFLHDGSRVTAMLDWEFSHLGDPMDDLGWWLFRGHDINGDCGDIDAQLAQWERSTGIAVDRSSIAYYRVFVMLRWLVSVAAVVDTGGAGMDRSVHHLLVPTLGVLLPRGLAEVMGHDLPVAPPAPDAVEPLGAAAAEAAMSDVMTVLMPAATDPESKRRLGASVAYLSHLMSIDRVGPAVRAELHDAAASLLGSSRTTLAEADTAVTERLGTLSDTALLEYFWRTGHARAALWPLVQGRTAQPLTPILR